MSRADDRRKQRLREEIRALKDSDLVEETWIDYRELQARWASEDEEATRSILRDLRADLDDAERQLRDNVVLSGEGRRRLRSFLFNKRWNDRKPGRARR